MQLIGQPKISKWLSNINLQNCPHFVILKGCKRCGKTLVSKIIANKLNAHYVEFKSSAEEVRKVIDTIYSIKEPTVYVCEDLDSMRPQASNALLKVTEEAPEHAYIIVHSVATPLATLLSRAQVFEFEPYTKEHYEEYSKLNNFEISQNADILMKTCNSLTDFEYYTVCGKFKQAYDLCCKVLDYISEVNKVNAFRILKDLSFKKEDEGLDCTFFLSVLLNTYIQRQGDVKFGNIIVKETQWALQKLQSTVFSKQNVMNMWVLNIINSIDEELMNAN